MKAIILAAGFGTRLYPLTRNVPKALLRLGDETLIDHLVGKLQRFPVLKEIVIVSNKRFYRDFRSWRKDSPHRERIRIIDNGVRDPETRLGAVKDLDLALGPSVDDRESFLVLCGDNYFEFPLGYFLLPCLGHSGHSFIGFYDVRKKHLASQYGVVEMDALGRITGFEEKPERPKTSQVSIGVYFFPAEYRRRVHEYLEIEKRDPDRIGDFIAWLAGKEVLHGIEFDGPWFDIGSVEAYDAAAKYFSRETKSHRAEETAK